MSLTSFIRTYMGKKVDYTDKDFKGDKSFQCVDLARQYYHDVWGIEQFPPLGADGGARKIYDNPGDVNVTPDSALADYSRGDVLIWDKSETNKYQNGVQLAFRSRENLRGALWK